MARPVVQPVTRALLEAGQSVWLDYIRRGHIQSGALAKMVEDGWITGMTSNPSIFEKAIAGSSDYDEALAALASQQGITPYDAFVSLAVEDIRAAADVLRPIYDQTSAKDGYVSLEVPPGIERDTAATVSEAKRLFALVDRPNVMIKVPGTPEGNRAVEELIADGTNINITLLFGASAYGQAAEAYIAGLERRLAKGLPLAGIASVASFFVSRVDTAVDALLPEGSPLLGKAAVANARHAYSLFQKFFSGPRWEKLAEAGAMVQRPLWASTGTKNAAYSDILYVQELIAAETVNTMPEATLLAVLDHAKVADTIAPNLARAEEELAALAKAGVDLDAVTGKLLIDGLAAFDKDFQKLLGQVQAALARARVGPAPSFESLGTLGPAVKARLKSLQSDKVVARIWERDHTVWKDDPTELSNRLGWLTVGDDLATETGDLKLFAESVAGHGYNTVVLLGMGGSSLAPEVLFSTFGSAPRALTLKVLDSTDPEQILAVEESIDLEKTLFIVASKSGGTIETLSQFGYFWEKIPDGRHFVAITDPGTALATLGRERNFRRVFENEPEIGGRYSALSHFGMVPAALIGVDVQRLLDRAHDMASACATAVPAVENAGAWLGAVVAESALAGKDKLTLVLPGELSTLGYWIEQLVAESTGKEGRGIVPIEGEALGDPSVYGDDRLFVAIGDNVALGPLEAAGHPVVRLPYTDPYQLGGEFFRWEFATAIAGQILQVNPFDQPDVQAAKDATAAILKGQAANATTATLAEILANVKAGDYVAITAFLPRNAETIAQLDAVRLALRDRLRVATTVGFGPRFLHSTGQLHKGGANNGVFIQVVAEEQPDIPIPGKTYTFGQLKAAQALGDLASLTGLGRRATRVTLRELQDELALRP
ncbi:MAG: bifunctional transaldolase/phosoglucose isomerase [Anaerolineaceae bacterium]